MVLFNMNTKYENKGVDPKLDTAGYDARGELVFERIEVDPRSGVRTVVFSYTHSPNNLLLPEDSLRKRFINLSANGQSVEEEQKALDALAAL